MLQTQWGSCQKSLSRIRKAVYRQTILRWAVLAGVVTLGSASFATAQVTYTVVPAVSIDEAVPAGSHVQQPTKHQAAIQVTLVVRDSTIAYIVNEMARQAHLRPVYSNSNPLFTKRISVHIVKMRAMDAFTAALKGTGLVAMPAPDGETVVVRGEAKSGAHTPVSGGIVMGRVTDSASGKGIAGAAVAVRGTEISTLTSDKGAFVLHNVPLGEQVLTIKLLGYKTVTHPLTVRDSGQQVIHIQLASVPTMLSGVVTTAAGTQERMRVGNDITVLNADSIMQIAPVSTVTELLETRVPGLVVMHTSGIPGAPARLRLRGSSSIERSDDPIVIVDGVRMYAEQSANNMSGSVSGAVDGYAGPSPLDQIDPNSIDKIEIFKGPSASALYGSDAANGVIVITTKRGQPGSTHWTLGLNQGISWLPGDYPDNFFRFGYNQGSVINGSVLCPSYAVSGCLVDSLVRFQALNHDRLSVLGHGRNQDASFTVSGGSEAIRYQVTGSGSQQDGVFRLPDFEKERFATLHGFAAPGWMRHPDHYITWGGTSRFDFQLGTHGGDIALTNSVFRSMQQQSSLQSAILQLQGAYVDTLQLGEDPLIRDYYQRVQFNAWTFNNAITLNYPVWSWLPVRATIGLNTSNGDNSTLTPRNYFLGGLDSLGQYAIARRTAVNKTLNLGTTLQMPEHGRLPGVSVALGINLNNQSQAGFSAQTTGLPVGVNEPTSFPGPIAPTQNALSTTTYGWYLEPTINFNSRFFINPGFRFDGGSASGSNAGLSPFPKLDFSWIAVDRPGDPLFGALTLLRPRLAFGIAGVQPDPQDQFRLLQIQTILRPGENVPSEGVAIQTLGNTQLRPERSREFEGGFDAELGQRRLTLKFTGYRKTRYDAIVSIPVAFSVGGIFSATGPSIATVARNIGTVRNSGIEAEAVAYILDNSLVSWQVNGNVSKRKNVVVALAPGQPIIVNQSFAGVGSAAVQSRIVPGYSLSGLWTKPIVGYDDANHDGLIDTSEVRVADSVVYMGAQEPNYNLVLGTTVGFFNGRLSINTTVAYENGMTQVNQAANASSREGLGNISIGNLASALNNPETPLSEQAAIAAVLSNATAYGLVQTVNTLRWSSLSINYQVPPATARLFHVSSMSVALQGSNLGLHTNYRGKDPNVNAFSAGTAVKDNGQLPQPRLWQMRVTLGY